MIVSYGKGGELDNTQGFRMIVKGVAVEHSHYVCVLILRLIVQALLTTVSYVYPKKGVTLLRSFPARSDICMLAVRV